MGADLYLNPSQDHQELWEQVRDQGDALRRERAENKLLRTALADRNTEIAALKQALLSLGRTDPVKFDRGS